jgi:hypothetical protein
MIHFAIGLCTLVGYIWFSKKYPRRPLADKFEMYNAITFGENYISIPRKYRGLKSMTIYDFECRITPDNARLRDLTEHKLKVPKEYVINRFKIAVHPDNTVKFLDLGLRQYHSDKCPKSQCFFLSGLKGRQLTEEFMIDVMHLLLTYDLDNPMSRDHWENPEFHKSNKQILDLMTI